VAAPEVTKAEAAFLHALLKHKVRFMVVGLSAAALQGAPVVTQDVDLWFEDLADPNLRSALKDTGASYVPPFEMNPPMFAGGGLELFDIVLRMDGLQKFGDEFENHVQIPISTMNIPALSLRRILASKLAANRKKDQLVIPVLEDAIKAQGRD
jgi:hypothetical protein